MHIKSRLLSILAWLSALLLFAPIAAIFVEAVSKPSPSFSHLADTVLWTYVKNSVFLVIGVCMMAVVWGLPSAWLTTRYDFPGRRFFRWALLLPMAMPAYLVAYVYGEVLGYTGVVQKSIRSLFGFQSAQDYWFFDMFTLGGGIFVLSLVFSPYVYWICLLNFNLQCQSLVNASRTLGASEWRTFFRVVLPLSRPALAIACSLVAMETLADFGTVSYLSVWTITTAIYDTWLNLFDLSAAAKLASVLLLLVVSLVLLEKYSRRRVGYHKDHNVPLIRLTLSGKYRWLATAWCGLILAVGFVVPMTYIVYYASYYIDSTDWGKFYRMLLDTLSLAVSVAGFAVLAALFVQLFQRLSSGTAHRAVPRQISSLGYAVPGTVLAIGVLIITTNVDKGFNQLVQMLGGAPQGLLFAGTLFAMGYAFLCRFAAVSVGSVESGMSKIPPSLEQTAYLFGYSPLKISRRVFMPLLRNSLLTAFMLVFLECMKELSAAILLRPFNVETLATYVYQYMSAEDFEVAALPAVVMVVAGLPAVLVLTASMTRK